MSDNQTVYSVLVSNIGWVLSEHDGVTSEDAARELYESYVHMSKTGEGSVMAYQEQVSLWANNEDGPIDFYDPEAETANDDTVMHECKFCHCLDAVDSAHSCLEFTDAGNAPDDTPEHTLWEAVMNGVDTGFVNIDGSEEE